MAESSVQRFRRRLVNEAIHRGWTALRRAGAIAPGTIRAERFAAFGDGTCIAFPISTLYGEAHIFIGRDTMIAPWGSISAGYSPEQTTVPERALVIGDRCLLGERVGLVAHESIVIGDDVWFGKDVYVTDANHGFSDLDVPIGKQLGPHRPVSIGDGSWVGHGSVILPGATIGRNCVVAAGSVVRGEVPDHTIVGGVPAKVIRKLGDPED